MFSEIMDHTGRQIVAFAPKLAVSIVIFLAFCITAWSFKKIALKIGRRVGEDRESIFRLIGSVLKTTTIVIGLITALGTLGIDVTALVAGLGLTGFALGFALRDSLSNLLAGVLLIYYRPFGRGDAIRVAGCEGVVTEINLRYTLLDGDGEVFLIPNSISFTSWIAVNKKAGGP
jgi:small-conductance mechanosensitive channel